MLTKAAKKFILDIILRKIPEEEFFKKYAINSENAPQVSLAILKDALLTQDSEEVEFGQLLGHRFGFTPEFLPILHELAEQPWHTCHENTVSALAMLKDPSSVPVLARTAVVLHPYKSWDKAFALNTKSVYALWRIGNPEAVRELGKLTHHGNIIIRAPAKELVRELSKIGASEEIKALAKSFLKRPAKSPKH